MSILRFSASCRRERQVAPGHVVRCDETFTDPAAFEAHMMGEHGAKKRFAGMATEPASAWNHYHAPVAAPGWRNGKMLPAHPHTAPRPVKGGLEKVAERIAAGEYRWTCSTSWIPDQPAAVAETTERAA